MTLTQTVWREWFFELRSVCKTKNKIGGNLTLSN
jgi:hypothetical protein